MIVESAVITGAGSGIGRAIALSLGEQRVHVLCISKTEKCHETADMIQSKGGSADGLALDLEEYSLIQKNIIPKIEARPLGRCGVVLAAAILGPDNKDLLADLESWEKAFRVNILGNLAIVKSLLPHMISMNFGRIIFFSGGGSANAFPTFPAYSASKTALVRVTENLHEELHSKGDFSVVCLAPGAVQTQMLAQVEKSGGVVKTRTAIEEPVEFVNRFLSQSNPLLSGRLIHVRDDWKVLEQISEEKQLANHWKLRRIE